MMYDSLIADMRDSLTLFNNCIDFLRMMIRLEIGLE